MIALFDLLNVNGGFLPVPDEHGRLGCQLHEAFECIRCLSLGSRLKHLSNSDEGQNHGCGLKIEIHHVFHDFFHVPIHLCPRHRKEHQSGPEKGGKGAKSNQRIHVWCPMDEPLKSTDKELLVDHHDDPSQKHLNESHGHMIVIKKGGQWESPHHVAHGKVHKHQEKAQ